MATSTLNELVSRGSGLSDRVDRRVKRALALVSQKSPIEAEEYKQWLTSLAQKTAEASKEGGFLGIGGVQISDDEKAAVNELDSALSAKA